MEIKRIPVGAFLANCYIVADEQKAIVIDPGDEVRKIVQELRSKKVNYIILTHYHFDHTAGVVGLKQLTGGEILIHREEKDYLVIDADHYLEDGEEIIDGPIRLRVIHTPGHSRGSICLLGEKIIFTGDTLFVAGAVGRTDFPGGSDADLEKSLQKLKTILKPGMQVYPGHDEDFVIAERFDII